VTVIFLVNFVTYSNTNATKGAPRTQKRSFPVLATRLFPCCAKRFTIVHASTLRNTAGLVQEATFRMEHIHIVNICYGVKSTKRFVTIHGDSCEGG